MKTELPERCSKLTWLNNILKSTAALQNVQWPPYSEVLVTGYCFCIFFLIIYSALLLLLEDMDIPSYKILPRLQLSPSQGLTAPFQELEYPVP